MSRHISVTRSILPQTPLSRQPIYPRVRADPAISSFVDWDIQVTPSGQFPVQDSIGDVVWTSCPGNCEFFPVHGRGTYFYGDYFDFDLAENITAEVWDSRTKRT